MKIVIDANILFSALIVKGRTDELILRNSLELFAPDFLLKEFNKYLLLILEKTRRSDQEILNAYNLIIKRITFIKENDFSDYITNAEEICPDENDIFYFALALKLNCGIWSNDKLLKNQEVITVYSTSDLLDKNI